MKKKLPEKEGERERGNVSGLLLREGDQDRHSWPLPEVKGGKGLKMGSESNFNYLFLLVLTHSGRQCPEAAARRMFTPHKAEPSPKTQLKIRLCVKPDKSH